MSDIGKLSTGIAPSQNYSENPEALCSEPGPTPQEEQTEAEGSIPHPLYRAADWLFEQTTQGQSNLSRVFSNLEKLKNKALDAAELQKFRAEVGEAREQMEAHPNLLERLQGFRRLGEGSLKVLALSRARHLKSSQDSLELEKTLQSWLHSLQLPGVPLATAAEDLAKLVAIAASEPASPEIAKFLNGHARDAVAYLQDQLIKAGDHPSANRLLRSVNESFGGAFGSEIHSSFALMADQAEELETKLPALSSASEKLKTLHRLAVVYKQLQEVPEGRNAGFQDKYRNTLEALLETSREASLSVEEKIDGMMSAALGIGGMGDVPRGRSIIVELHKEVENRPLPGTMALPEAKIRQLEKTVPTLLFLQAAIEGNYQIQIQEAAAKQKSPRALLQERRQMRDYLAVVHSYLRDGKASTTEAAIEKLAEDFGASAPRQFYTKLGRVFEFQIPMGDKIGISSHLLDLVRSEKIEDAGLQARIRFDLVKRFTVDDSLNRRAEALISAMLQSIEIAAKAGSDETLLGEIQEFKKFKPYLQATHRALDHVLSMEGLGIGMASMFTAGLVGEIAALSTMLRFGAVSMEALSVGQRLVVGGARFGANWLTFNASEATLKSAFRLGKGEALPTAKELRIQLITSFFSLGFGHLAATPFAAMTGAVPGMGVGRFFAFSAGMVKGEDMGTWVQGLPKSHEPFLLRFYEAGLNAAALELGAKAGKRISEHLLHNYAERQFRAREGISGSFAASRTRRGHPGDEGKFEQSADYARQRLAFDFHADLPGLRTRSFEGNFHRPGEDLPYMQEVLTRGDGIRITSRAVNDSLAAFYEETSRPNSASEVRGYSLELSIGGDEIVHHFAVPSRDRAQVETLHRDLTERFQNKQSVPSILTWLPGRIAAMKPESAPARVAESSTGQLASLVVPPMFEKPAKTGNPQGPTALRPAQVFSGKVGYSRSLDNEIVEVSGKNGDIWSAHLRPCELLPDEAYAGAVVKAERVEVSQDGKKVAVHLSTFDGKHTFSTTLDFHQAEKLGVVKKTPAGEIIVFVDGDLALVRLKKREGILDGRSALDLADEFGFRDERLVRSVGRISPQPIKVQEARKIYLELAPDIAGFDTEIRQAVFLQIVTGNFSASQARELALELREKKVSLEGSGDGLGFFKIAEHVPLDRYEAQILARQFDFEDHEFIETVGRVASRQITVKQARDAFKAIDPALQRFPESIRQAIFRLIVEARMEINETRDLATQIMDGELRLEPTVDGLGYIKHGPELPVPVFGKTASGETYRLTPHRIGEDTFSPELTYATPKMARTPNTVEGDQVFVELHILSAKDGDGVLTLELNKADAQRLKIPLAHDGKLDQSDPGKIPTFVLRLLSSKKSETSGTGIGLLTLGVGLATVLSSPDVHAAVTHSLGAMASGDFTGVLATGALVTLGMANAGRGGWFERMGNRIAALFEGPGEKQTPIQTAEEGPYRDSEPTRPLDLSTASRRMEISGSIAPEIFDHPANQRSTPFSLLRQTHVLRLMEPILRAAPHLRQAAIEEIVLGQLNQVEAQGILRGVSEGTLRLRLDEFGRFSPMEQKSNTATKVGAFVDPFPPGTLAKIDRWLSKFATPDARTESSNAGPAERSPPLDQKGDAGAVPTETPFISIRDEVLADSTGRDGMFIEVESLLPFSGSRSRYHEVEKTVAFSIVNPTTDSGIMLDGVKVLVDPQTRRVVRFLEDPITTEVPFWDYDQTLRDTEFLRTLGVSVKVFGLIPEDISTLAALYTEPDHVEMLQISKQSLNIAIEAGRLVIEVDEAGTASIKPRSEP